MICEESRLLIGAEPVSTAPALEEHLYGCPACRGFREEMRTLDANIHRAMQQPPDRVSVRVPRHSAAWRGWALAASVLLAMLAALALWALRPTDTLAHDVMVHVQGEPESWLATQHVDAAGIDRALRGAGVELNLTSETITYAQSCWFRGHYVPHLVVQTERGPATVLILRHEHVRARHSFREAGMTGVIVPAGEGSLAVLTRGDGNIDNIADSMRHNVRWLPGGA